MTFLISTRRAIATDQTGVVTNTFVGASMHGAVADSSDSTYLRLGARARLDNQVIRLDVQAPVLAATDRVYSLGVRLKIRSVVLGAGESAPILLLWLRTESGDVEVAGELPPVRKQPFDPITCPTDAIASEWVDMDLGQLTFAPGGGQWDQTGNLTTLSIEIGRGDDEAPDLDIAALYFDVYYQQISTVTVTSPVDGDETRPPVEWVTNSPNYVPQQGYRVAVYPKPDTEELDFEPYSSPALFTSGLAGATPDTSFWVLGEDQRWPMPGDLVDGEYVAYVQATSQWAGGGGDFYTAVSSITWTRDGSTASPPNPAVLDSVEYSRAEMGTLITFSPDGATDAFCVQRRTDGTEAGWRNASPGLARVLADGDNPVTVKDRFMPLNAPCEYRVIALAGTPLVAALEPSNVLSETANDDRYILRHPTNDLLDVAIELKNPKMEEGLERTKREMAGIAYFSGGPGTRSLPMAQFGPTYGWEYDLTLLYLTLEDPDLWDKVDQLHEARTVLFFQLPTKSEQLWGALGPGASGRDVKEKLTVAAGNRTKYQRILRNSMFTETLPPETWT